MQGVQYGGCDAREQARHMQYFSGMRTMADQEPVTRINERCFGVSGVCWSVRMPASLGRCAALLEVSQLGFTEYFRRQFGP